MTIRARYKITASVSSTSAEEKDLANQAWEVVTDTLGEGGSYKTTLAAGATNISIQLSDVASAKFVAVRTAAKDPTQTPVDITLKRNSTTGEALVIRPIGDAKEGHFLMATDALTNLYATNAGSVDMDVTVVMVGD